MTTLPPNATLAVIRRYAMTAVEELRRFLEGLDRFGREPGEPWHASADEWIGRFLELEKIVEKLKSNISMPQRVREEAREAVERSVSTLCRGRSHLMDAILDACPALPELPDPPPVHMALWRSYDKITAGLPERALQRLSVQRLLQRARDPSGVFPLVVSGIPNRLDRRYWEVLPMLPAVIASCPLHNAEGRTVLQQTIAMKAGDPVERAKNRAFFDRFVRDVMSPSALTRKAARKRLDDLLDRARDIHWGKASPTEGDLTPATVVEVWRGVQEALGHPDPAYRLAAIAALPRLLFSNILLADPAGPGPFVARGLQDEHGMVRYRVYRFARDFFLIHNVSQPELARAMADHIKALTRGRLRPAPSRLARKLVNDLEAIRIHQARVTAQWPTSPEKDTPPI